MHTLTVSRIDAVPCPYDMHMVTAYRFDDWSLMQNMNTLNLASFPQQFAPGAMMDMSLAGTFMVNSYNESLPPWLLRPRPSRT